MTESFKFPNSTPTHQHPHLIWICEETLSIIVLLALVGGITFYEFINLSTINKK